MNGDLTGGLIATTLCPTPCDATPGESNAPESPLTAFQHRTIVSDKLMDWMESNQLSFNRAADVLGVSSNVIVSLMSRVPIASRTFLKISAKVPGLSSHLLGARNG